MATVRVAVKPLTPPDIVADLFRELVDAARFGYTSK